MMIDASFIQGTGLPPLHYACLHGQILISKYLIEQKCDPRFPATVRNRTAHNAIVNVPLFSIHTGSRDSSSSLCSTCTTVQCGVIEISD